MLGLQQLCAAPELTLRPVSDVIEDEALRSYMVDLGDCLLIAIRTISACVLFYAVGGAGRADKYVLIVFVLGKIRFGRIKIPAFRAAMLLGAFYGTGSGAQRCALPIWCLSQCRTRICT